MEDYQEDYWKQRKKKKKLLKKQKKNQRIYLDMIDFHINLNLKTKRKKMIIIKNMKKIK